MKRYSRCALVNFMVGVLWCLSVSTLSFADTSTSNQKTLKNSPLFASGSTLYWQLQGAISKHYDVDVYGIDLEDNETNDLITSLKKHNKLVLCYFSAGSYEDWRSDKNEFDKLNDLGNPLNGWPGEYHVNIRSPNVRRIMKARIDRAAAAGCDAVEPDNTDTYQANNGLALTEKDQADYLRFLAHYAHSNGLKIALKNTIELIDSENFAELFDFALNESCYAYDECDQLLPFIHAGKAVYIAMYEKNNKKSRCADAIEKGFNLVFYGSDYALDGRVYETC